MHFCVYFKFYFVRTNVTSNKGANRANTATEISLSIFKHLPKSFHDYKTTRQMTGCLRKFR